MKRRHFIQKTAAITGALSTLPLGEVMAKDEEKFKIEKSSLNNPPNILFIMTDQQRYDCVAANGNPIIHTPNLDRLASQSANFSHTYVQSPVCTPSMGMA